MVQTPLQSFQRALKGLLSPSPKGLLGFQRQGMDQRKKSTVTITAVPAFGAGATNPTYTKLGEGKYSLPYQDGSVANSFAYLSNVIKSGSGKWYWEAKITGGASLILWGVAKNLAPGAYGGYSGVNYGWYNLTPVLWAEAPATVGTTAAPALASGDTLGVLYDSTTHTLDFYVNGTLVTGGTSSTGLAAVDMWPLFAFQSGVSAEIHLGVAACTYPAPPGAQYYV